MKVSNKKKRGDEKTGHDTNFITIPETKCCLSVGGGRQIDAASCSCSANPAALVHLATTELTSVNRVQLGHISGTDARANMAQSSDIPQRETGSRTALLCLTPGQEGQPSGHGTLSSLGN